MTTAQHFKAVMAQRRSHPRGTAEFEYLTNAARKLAMIVRGVPASEWGQ